MKYLFKIADEKGQDIKPVFQTGTFAQHFAACVGITTKILNDKELFGEPTEHPELVAAQLFFHSIKQHKVAGEFSENNEMNTTLKALSSALEKKNSEEILSLLLQFITEVKVDGVASCSLQMKVTTYERVSESNDEEVKKAPILK